MAGQAPSFKTDIHRNKTRKWVEAPRNDYGGDDWGVADEYNEYGTYDEGESSQAAPVPQQPTGFRHHGQTASIGSAKGRGSYEAPTAQPTLPSLERTNSFDTGDEKRALSAVNSPAVGQGEMLPSQRFEAHTQPQYTQQDHSSESYHTVQSRRPSIPSIAQQRASESFPQHMSPQFHIQHTEPSHEPEYDDRDYSDNRGQAGLGLSNANEDSQRHSFLPPLRSELEEDPYHYQMAGHQGRLPPFPPRKSSLSTRSRPDLNELYQAQQANEPLPGPIPSHYGPTFGAETGGNGETNEEVDEAPQTAPRFVRPADIYKRMEEEKEKERRASDASRRSPERPEAQITPAEARTQGYSVQQQPEAAQEHTSSRTSGEAAPVHVANSRDSWSPEVPESEPPRSPQLRSASGNDSRPAQYVPLASAEQSHSSKPSLLGFTVSNPALARALGADAQDDTQPAQRSVTSDPSPLLPSIGRFSGFGSFADDIWQSQPQSSGNAELVTEAERNSFDRVSTRSHSSNKHELLSFHHDHSSNSLEHNVAARHSTTQSRDEAKPASQHNAAVYAPSKDTTQSDSTLGSPTDYYFSDQAGSMDDRLYANQEDDDDLGPSAGYTNDRNTYENNNATTKHNPMPSESHGTQSAQLGSITHSRNSSAQVSAHAQLPDAAQAVSRAELEADHDQPSRTSIDDSNSFEEQKEDQYVDTQLQRQKNMVSDNSASFTQNPPVELEKPVTLPESVQALSRHEIDAGAAKDDVPPTNHAGQDEDQGRQNYHTPNPLHIANSHHSHDIFRDTSAIKPMNRVNSMRDEHEDDYSPSIYTPQSARPGLETREADLAPAMEERPEEESSSKFSRPTQIAQSNFTTMRQPPAPIQSRFLQEPQNDPIARATSPGGRVKQLADKFDEIHTLSRQSTVQSPTGSASGRRERSGHSSDDIGNTSSLRSNQDFERPRLPGEWISYADTIESGDHSEDDGDYEEAEMPNEDEVPTPTAERPESPIDFSPTPNKKKSLYGATSTEEGEGPMAALAAAGHALASSLQGMIGMHNDEHDNDERDTSDADSDATESVLPTPDITPDVNERPLNSFHPQPSSLARDIPVASIEEPTIEHARQASPDDYNSREDHHKLRQSESADIAYFGNVKRETESPELPTEHNVKHDEDVADEYDDDVEDEPVASPAPLRPHSHVPRINTESMPQRPIWPSQASAMSINSINDSPEDTESDQLRKDIISSLSPNPKTSRGSMDVESNPRSSTEYPQFGAIQEKTPERKLASTPLHLSPPSTLAVGGHSHQHEGSSIDSAPKTNFLTVQPPQPAGISRESTLLPQIYDSYWTDRDSQDDDNQYGKDSTDQPVSQTISALSSVREERTSETNDTTQATRGLPQENPKLRDESFSRPNFLAKRFSWEAQEDGATNAPAAEALRPRQSETGDPSNEIDGPSSDTATNAVGSSHATVEPVPSHDQSRDLNDILSDLPHAKSLTTAVDVPETSMSLPPSVDTSVNSVRRTSDALSSASPAQYKYERPFQRSPSESAGTRLGIRKTSINGIPPRLSERNRTISSGQFSLPGETALSGFKTIASIRDTPERIAAFDRTREGFANLDTGLNEWLTYMVHSNPELLDDADTPIRRTGNSGFAGSVRHKLAPSLSKLTRTNDNASTASIPASIPEEPSSRMGTRSPSMTRRTPSTSEAGSSKGKAFLQSAGQGAKGFFAKSKSKMRGASGQQKIEPPLPKSDQHTLDSRRQYESAIRVSIQDKHESIRDERSSPSMATHTPVLHGTVRGVPSATAFIATRNRVTQPDRTETPMSEVSETGIDFSNDGHAAIQQSISSPGKPPFSTRNEEHALDTGLPSTKRDLWDVLASSDAYSRSSNAAPTSKHNDNVPSALPQHPAMSYDTQDSLCRTISPLQSPAPSSIQPQDVMTTGPEPSDDTPISPISINPSSNLQLLSPLPTIRPMSFILQQPPAPAPTDTILPAFLRAASDQTMTSPRLSLALEKQQSAVVSEREIHPALLERGDSSYSIFNAMNGDTGTLARDDKEQMREEETQNDSIAIRGRRRRGSSAGPKPPDNVDRLPPKVRRWYEMYGSQNDDMETESRVPPVPALPVVGNKSGPRNKVLSEASTEGDRKRSKSPFARWRGRSKSRDGHKRGQSSTQDLNIAASAAAFSLAVADDELQRATGSPAHRVEYGEGATARATNAHNESPLRFHSRSRSRSGHIRSDTEATRQPTTGDLMPSAQRGAIIPNYSDAAPSQEQPQSQRGRSELREHNMLKEQSVSANRLSQTLPLEQQESMTNDDGKGKRRSWYGGTIRPSLSGDGDGQSEKRRSWYSRSSSIGTMPKTTSRPSLPGRGDSEGKRRSWYGGLLCNADQDQEYHTAQAQNISEPADPVERSMPVQPASSAAARFHGPSQFDGTTASQDGEKRRARSVSAKRDATKTMSASDQEQAKPLAPTMQSSSLLPAKIGATVARDQSDARLEQQRDNVFNVARASNDAGSSYVAINPAQDGVSEEIRRISGGEGGVYDPYYPAPSSPQAAQQPYRPWATPNHARQNPSFLEHKQWRRQQDQQQHVLTQFSQLSGDVSPAKDTASREFDRTPAQAQSAQAPLGTQRREQLSSARTQSQRHEHIATAAPSSTPPFSGESLRTSTHSPLPLPSRMSGLPKHLVHLSLSLTCPPSSSSADEPSSSQAIPLSPPPSSPSSPSVMTRGRPPGRPRASSLAGSLATSINVNIGHQDEHGDGIPVPPLPAAVLIATTPLYDPEKPEEEAEDVQQVEMNRRLKTRNGGGAIARWRDGVARAGVDRSTPPQWPLSDTIVPDTVDEPVRLSTRIDEGVALGSKGWGQAKGMVEKDHEEVVLSPTLNDGPGWEWRPPV